MQASFSSPLRGDTINATDLYSCTVAVIFASLNAQATMAPKYERLRQLGLIFEHLRDVADLMPQPIEKIEISYDGSARVVADKCFVPVKIDYESSQGPKGEPIPGGGITRRPTVRRNAGRLRINLPASI